MRSMAASMLKRTMDRIVNPRLRNPIKTYKSSLLNEHCVVYENRRHDEDAVVDNDIGLLEYLVQTDKTSLRLQQYIIRKHHQRTQQQ